MNATELNWLRGRGSPPARALHKPHWIALGYVTESAPPMPPGHSEAKQIHVARQIRAADPSIYVLPGTAWDMVFEPKGNATHAMFDVDDEFDARPELELHCDGSLALRPDGTRVHDWANPAARALWASAFRRFAGSGALRGAFLDGIGRCRHSEQPVPAGSPADGCGASAGYDIDSNPNCSAAQRAAWSAGEALAVAAVRQAVGVDNLTICNGHDTVFSSQAGEYRDSALGAWPPSPRWCNGNFQEEWQGFVVDVLLLLRAAAVPDYVSAVRSIGFSIDKQGDTDHSFNRTLAAFLVAAQEHSYYLHYLGYDCGNSGQMDYHFEYTQPLGRPLGNATGSCLAPDGPCELRREFAHGVKVYYSGNASQGKERTCIRWGDESFTEYGDGCTASGLRSRDDDKRPSNQKIEQRPVAMALQSLEGAPDAVCLDGSAYKYYWRKGADSDAARFLLAFQGGGWCNGAAGTNVTATTVAACAARAHGVLGSSKQWPAILGDWDPHGATSTNCTANPAFCNWSVAYLPYCDGTSFAGSLDAPVPTEDPSMPRVFFRGRPILTAVLDDMLQHKALGCAEAVVVSGHSAGGLATFLHADFIRERLPSSGMKLFAGVPDGGWFMDSPNLAGVHAYGQSMRALFRLANASGSFNKECVAARTEYDCLFPEHAARHIKTPIHVTQSLYDAWQLPNVLGLGCHPAQADCDGKQLRAFQGFRNRTLEGLRGAGMLMPARAGGGAWVDACIAHIQGYDGDFGDNPAYKVPGSMGITVAQSLAAWLAANEGGPVVNVSNYHVDAVRWPHNAPCAKSGALLTMAKTDDSLRVRAGGSRVVRIVDGDLLQDDGKRKRVGSKTSEIQAQVIAKAALWRPEPYMPNVTAIVNASFLRFLIISGVYQADAALRLPSFFVLAAANATFETAPDCSTSKDGLCSGSQLVKDGAVVLANRTNFTAVLGGSFDCSAIEPSSGGRRVSFGVRGIWGLAAWGFTVHDATVRNCGIGANHSSGNIHFQGRDGLNFSEPLHGEIRGTTIAGPSRGIWTETIGKVAIHHNDVRADVGIDLDGFTGDVYVYSNQIIARDRDASGYGLWIEEGSQGVFAWNNTIARHATGMYIYNGGVKARGNSNHLLFENTVLDSKGSGLGWGYHNGMAAVASGSYFGSNVFVGNGNRSQSLTPSQVFTQGGAGQVMFDNRFDVPLLDAVAAILEQPVSAVSIFDPASDDGATAKVYYKINDGYLMSADGRTKGEWVGTNTSQLQAFIGAYDPQTGRVANSSRFPPPPTANVTALVNSTWLRYLELEGTYIADSALNLPSYFVLKFAKDSTLSAAPICEVASSPCRFCAADGCDHHIPCCESDLISSGAMIKANNTAYSAVLGGQLDCNKTDPSLGGINATFGLRAVWAIKSHAFTLSHATIAHCGIGANGSSGNVEFEGGGYGGQLSYSHIFGGSRGLWTERGMSKLAVHHNLIESGLDIDAGSGGSFIYSNRIIGCGCYGLWVRAKPSGLVAALA
jgi:hypothetical protein